MALGTPGRAEVSLEYAVKAAYLPKFIPFITWPDGTFSSPTAPVTICVLGPDPFSGRLDREAGSIKAGERPIVVHHLAAPDPEVSCQLLFLGSGTDLSLVEGTLDAMKGRAVVTVTDSGMRAHGIISFVIDTNHVRFDIDDVQAAQDGLTISSQLLGLAHAVRQRGEQ
jgi:YfiR/HmsC-like